MVNHTHTQFQCNRSRLCIITTGNNTVMAAHSALFACFKWKIRGIMDMKTFLPFSDGARKRTDALLMFIIF